MMKLDIVRAVYKIPPKYRLRWAVIVEESRNGLKECRLGVLLKGTPKAVDVMKRKFVQAELLEPVKRKTYPARKKSDGKYLQFDTTAPDVHETVRISKDHLDVEYFTAQYSPELMDTFLF